MDHSPKHPCQHCELNRDVNLHAKSMWVPRSPGESPCHFHRDFVANDVNECLCLSLQCFKLVQWCRLRNVLKGTDLLASQFCLQIQHPLFLLSLSSQSKQFPWMQEMNWSCLFFNNPLQLDMPCALEPGVAGQSDGCAIWPLDRLKSTQPMLPKKPALFNLVLHSKRATMRCPFSIFCVNFVDCLCVGRAHQQANIMRPKL